MFYPENVVQDVIAMNDIVDVVSGYLALTPRAGNHFGLCPFHGEKTPSFSVSPTKQIFYCFGCGAGGSVLTFIMKLENLDFVAALKLLADRVRYQLPEKDESKAAKENRQARENIAELNKRAARFYHDYLLGDTADAKYARRYLEKRGVEEPLTKRFGIGLSPPAWDGLLNHLSDTSAEHVASAGLASQSKKDATRYYDRFRSRLMFPIIDARNRVVGFGGRIMDEDAKEAKYVNTPETALFHKSDNLYGLNLARKARVNELIIVEGYMDVLAMHKWGFINSVGVLGTALNDNHTRLLKNAGCSSVVLMLDGDDAGVRATLRAIPVLTKAGIKVKTLDISKADANAKDPDEYLSIHGAVPLKALIKNAKSHVSFQVGLLKQKHDLETTDGRVSFTHDAAELLATLPSAIETEAYVSEISKETAISETAIHTEVNKQRGVTPTTTMYSTPRRRVKTNANERGLKKAKEALLHVVLTYPNAAAALEKSGYIGTEEIGEGLYTDLLQLAFKNAAEKKHMNPADIVTAFESHEQAIAEIFIDQPTYDTKAAIEKALNETAFILKRAWALNQMENAQNSGETLQTLGFAARNMPTLSI